MAPHPPTEQQQQPGTLDGPEEAGRLYAVPEDVEAVLRRYGVHKGQSLKRAALAKRLAAERDFTAEGCERLYREYRDVRGERNPGWQVTQALEKGWWRNLLEDIRAENVLRRGERDHGATRRAEDDVCQADARRTDPYKAGWAYSRLAYERANPRDLARELGVSVEKLPTLVRAGAEQYGVDPNKAAEMLRKAVER